MNYKLKYFIGFILIRNVLGVKDFWKAIHHYVLSFFYLYDLSTDAKALGSPTPLILISESIPLILCFYIEKLLGTKKTLTTSVLILAIGFFLCFNTNNLNVFKNFFGISIGVSNGLTLMLVVWPGWNYYYNKKGIVTALSGVAYLLGYFYVNFIVYGINPDNESQLFIRDGFYYDLGMVRGLARALRFYAAIVFFLGLIGILIFKKKPHSVKTNENSNSSETSETLKPKINAINLLRKKDLWICILICFLLSYYFASFTMIYEPFLIGSVWTTPGIIIQIFSLLLMGYCYDKFSTIKVTYFYCLGLSIHCVFFYLVYDDSFCFGISYLFFAFFSSNVYVVNAMMAKLMFPNHRKEGFSLVNCGYFVACFFLIVFDGNELENFDSKFLILFSLPVIAVILTLFLKLGELKKVSISAENT